MAWTDPKTWTAGEEVKAADLNTHLRDNLSALYSFDGAVVQRHAAKSVANTTYEDVDYDTSIYDTGSYWSVSNPERFTVSKSGYYRLHFTCDWNGAATGYLESRIFYEATSIMMGTRLCTTAVSPSINIETIYYCEAGHYFKSKAYQTSGSALSMGIDYHNQFSITFLGE